MTSRCLFNCHGLAMLVVFSCCVATGQALGDNLYRSPLGTYEQDRSNFQNRMADMERERATNQLRFDLQYGMAAPQQALRRYESSLDGVRGLYAPGHNYSHRDRMAEMEDAAALGQLRYDLRYGKARPNQAIDRYESSTPRRRWWRGRGF